MPQQLELIWALYDKNSKHYLLLYLGEAQNYTIALDAHRATPRDTQIIRANLDHLRRTDLKSLMQWLKDNLHDTYKQGIRKFETSRLIIKKQYSLGNLNAVKKTAK